MRNGVQLLSRFLPALALLALLSCRSHAGDDIEPVPENVSVVQRLSGFYQPSGWVVSLRDDVGVNQGDSLLFSGLALYALDCQSGSAVADAIAGMLASQNGGLYRHPSMAGQPASFDGAIGMYRGIAKRIRDCSEADRWRPLLALHKTNQDSFTYFPEPLDYVRDLLFSKVGLVGVPSAARAALLSLALADWVEAVKASKTVGFRAHLALLTMQTCDELGVPVQGFLKDNLCSASDGMGLLTFDHWCGRSGLDAWINGFQYDVYQYKHQRAVWEGPDAHGDSEPAIDYLVGEADAQ